MSDEPKITVGSGNVFADLDLPDAEELLRKAILTSRISRVVMDRKRNYEEVAGILGLMVEDLRDLIRGRWLRVSTAEQLVGYLEALGETVEPFEVTVTDIPRKERVVCVKPTEADIAVCQTGNWGMALPPPPSKPPRRIRLHEGLNQALDSIAEHHEKRRESQPEE